MMIRTLTSLMAIAFISSCVANNLSKSEARLERYRLYRADRVVTRKIVHDASVEDKQDWAEFDIPPRTFRSVFSTMRYEKDHPLWLSLFPPTHITVHMSGRTQELLIYKCTIRSPAYDGQWVVSGDYILEWQQAIFDRQDDWRGWDCHEPSEKLDRPLNSP